MSQEIEKGQVLLKSYNDFLSFVDKEIDEQVRLDLLLDGLTSEWVAVQNLLDVLKQENKFLSKDEFINLVSKKKLRMGNPFNFGFVENINGRTTRWYECEIEKKSKQVPREADYDFMKKREEYWDYVKKCLFGDPEGSDRGLMDINVLTDKDLKEIINLICSDLTVEDEESFFLLVRGIGVIDKNDIFCPKNKKRLANDLIKSFNKQNTNNSKKRLIAGIILLVLGIIGCGIITGLGLSSKLACILLLFFITTLLTGSGCLLWKKIIGCLNPCCSQIKSNIVNKISVDKKNSKDQQIAMAKGSKDGPEHS